MKTKLPGLKTASDEDGVPVADGDCHFFKDHGTSQHPGIETEPMALTPDESLAMAEALGAPGEPGSYTRAAARRYRASCQADKARRKAALDELTEYDEELGLR